MPEQNEMSLTEHLTELRNRIIWILLVFVITLIGGLIVAEPVITYLKNQPTLAHMDWNVFSPWDGLRVYMMFAFMIALAVSLPFILYQLWSFMKPGLRSIEQKAVYRYIPAAVILFLVGFSFAYFIIFPMAFRFTTIITDRLELVQTYGVIQYFTFMFNIVLPMSILFQLPVVVMFLTEIHLLTPKRLRKIRKPAYMVLVILSTIVTPPDLISAILVAVPLIMLYECSVWLASRIYRKKLARQQELLEAA